MKKCYIKIIFVVLAIIVVASILFFVKDRQADEIYLSENEKTALNSIPKPYDESSEIENSLLKIENLKYEIEDDSENNRTDYYLNIAIAQQYELLGDGTQSAIYLFKASKEESDRALPLLKLGELFTKAGLYDRAEKYFEKAISNEPQIVQNHIALLNLYIQKMSVGAGKVQSVFNNARNETGDDIEILRLYADWLESNGEYIRAIDILKFISRKDPEDKKEIELEIERLGEEAKK